jgi:hypothetical protein
MPTTYKVLGQSKPTAATLTTLYTVPSSTSTIISTLTVCNTTATPDEIRIAVRPAGESIADKHYIVHTVGLPAFANYTYTLGVTLAATDVVSVYSLDGDTSFNLFGTEIS